MGKSLFLNGSIVIRRIIIVSSTPIEERVLGNHPFWLRPIGEMPSLSRNGGSLVLNQLDNVFDNSVEK